MADIDVAKHWNDNADQWARDVRAGFDVYRDQFTFPAFLDALPPINELDVIDFGCGEGTNTRAFARLGARVTGIDLSARMIEHGRKTEEADPLGIGYHVTSYSDHCGMPDASYDAVLSTMALMDGPDLPGTMQEAYRLLRPGGFILFSVVHPCFITPGLGWEKDADGRNNRASGGSVFRQIALRGALAFWSPPQGRRNSAVRGSQISADDWGLPQCRSLRRSRHN